MRRIFLDVILMVLFLLALDYSYTRVRWHEYLGSAFFILSFLHCAFNYRWFKTVGKGSWNVRRGLTFIINGGLVLSLLVSLITGLMISQILFQEPFGPALNRSIFVHQMHVLAPYIMLLLVGIHLGLHWQVLWLRFTNSAGILTGSRWYRVVCYTGVVLLAAAGVYASFRYNIGSRLMVRHMFGGGIPPSLLSFMLWHICIIALYAAGAYNLQNALCKKIFAMELKSSTKRHGK